MSAPVDLDPAVLMDSAWMDVLRKMDETYSDLVAYQVELEEKNADLEAIRQFMASVMGAMTDILIVCDTAGIVHEVNSALAAATGRTPEEICGAPARALFAEPSREALAALLADTARRAAGVATELSVAGPSGTSPFEFHATPRLDARGRVVGAVLIGRPVGELRQAYERLAATHAELKAAQARLVNSEKMASLGRLVAGVAHELNNPISFVYGNAHALEKYVGRLETYFDAVRAGAPRDELIALRNSLRLDRAIRGIREAVSGSLEGAERVRDIVEDLRRFSADGRGESEPFNLVQVVSTAIAWVVKGDGNRVEVTMDAPAHVVVHGRAGHIQQVIMNIVQNAVDAMEATEAPRLAVTIAADGEAATVTLADTGPGMTAEVQSAAFDPFFTTKPTGKGTGLGLSISYQIVEQHGGTLGAANGPDGGAVFTMRLPLTPADPPTEGAAT